MGATTFTPLAGADADKAYFSMPAPSKNGEQYRGVRGVVAFSSSYATGGDTIPLASVGLVEIREVLVDPMGVGGGADAFQSGLSVKLGGTPQVPLLRAFDAAGTEVTNATNLSSRSVGVYYLGH